MRTGPQKLYFPNSSVLINDKALINKSVFERIFSQILMPHLMSWFKTKIGLYPLINGIIQPDNKDITEPNVLGYTYLTGYVINKVVCVKEQ